MLVTFQDAVIKYPDKNNLRKNKKITKRKKKSNLRKEESVLAFNSRLQSVVVGRLVG